MSHPVVTRIAQGTYRVEHEGRHETVYVAGPTDDRWAFWHGQVFRHAASHDPAADTRQRARIEHSLTAPMPATVVNVLVSAGSSVRGGDALIVLEAMKMELVIRAPGDGAVSAVHCREGDLVQPDTILIDFV